MINGTLCGLVDRHAVQYLGQGLLTFLLSPPVLYFPQVLNQISTSEFISVHLQIFELKVVVVVGYCQVLLSEANVLGLC